MLLFGYWPLWFGTVVDLYCLTLIDEPQSQTAYKATYNVNFSLGFYGIVTDQNIPSLSN